MTSITTRNTTPIEAPGDLLVGHRTGNGPVSFVARRNPKHPVRSHIQSLDECCAILRDRNEHGIAGDLEALAEALRSMLRLTSGNDCLFGDEIRNLLLVRHTLPMRRGTALDPLTGRRKSGKP